jgi:hypothetical protein
LCPRWDTYIADDVEDPKFITLYPKGYIHTYIHIFIHSFIHSSKLNTICNCTIQYLQKERAISFCSSMTPKKLNTNFAITLFFLSDFYAKNKSRNLFLFVHS